jgi:2-methylisocitrate lyase-like PEP mutase family enzyme
MTFAELHTTALPLLLPNAWDVPSALALADAGYPAIGTTSFGVAMAAGRPDGARRSRDPNRELVAALRDLPAYLSVDVEDGYSDDPAEVAGYVADLAPLIAGINLEDSTAEALVDPERHADKIRAVKDRTPGVFVNARVDTYWLKQSATPEETLRRAARYVAAGADGVFVPGATDPDLLRTLAAAIPRPLNVLAVPGRPLSELGDLGVRRVSTGSLPYRAAMQAALDAVAAVRDGRTPPSAVAYDDLQAALTALDRACAAKAERSSLS